MSPITIRDANEIARYWSERESGKIPGFVGAYLTGSTAWKDEAEIHSPASDIDIIVVIEGETLPDKIGKFAFQGELLEVSFATIAEISKIDSILSNYHLAGSFRKPTTIFDPSGRVTAIQSAAAAQFADPEFIRRRLKHAYQNAQNFLEIFRKAEYLHDQVTSLFFAAGVTTHMLLVAALENPTVRRRYIASRVVLRRVGDPALHEHLLETLGSGDMDTAAVQSYLDNLAPQFDFAGSVLSTPYRFADDMKPAAQPVAIGGSQEMIDQGFQREAMFWILAVYSRSRAVISVDAPKEALVKFDELYWEVLNGLGIGSAIDMDRRAIRVEKDIERVWNVAEKLIEKR